MQNFILEDDYKELSEVIWRNLHTQQQPSWETIQGNLYITHGLLCCCQKHILSLRREKKEKEQAHLFLH